MSTIEAVEELKEQEESGGEDERPATPEAKSPPKDIIRYSLSTLLSLRSSKLSQAKPACKNSDLSCMAHHKPPPKMLIANMMPKFALNQMQNRGEESISPLSFHSNSSSSSNLSYQKRYQDSGRGEREREGGDGYSNSRYYYNKYNKYDDNGGSSRIIYKTTGANANANNGNNIRFLKKAYNSKYENQESSSVGLLSNKNILENSARVITLSDIRNKKHLDLMEDDKKEQEKLEEAKKSDDKNNNEKKEAALEKEAHNNDLKNLPDDITNHLDDMFNNLNMNQLLPEKMTEERESSRFSKWFTVNKDDVKDEKPDMQNNNDNGGVSFPQSVESEKYFQPIDKVESNSLFQLLKGPPEIQKDDNPLMHMIQQGQQQKSPNSGQVHSVEELEARLRQHKGNEEQKNNESEQKVLQNFFQQHQQQHQQQQQQFQPHPPPMVQNQEDVTAFKKLLSQMANEEGGKVPAPNLLQQMMNKSFPQQHEVMMQRQKIPAAKINPATGMMIPQQQQFGNNIDMIKFMQQQQKIPVPQQIPEVMKRPEVQAVVQELNSGEISQYNLWQRLTTPGLSPIERDIITSALNIFNANNGANGNFPKPIGQNNLFPPMKPNVLAAPIPMPQGSPLSPVPPPLDQHLLFQHQAAAAAANKLRLSPLPAAGFSMGPAVLPPNNTLTLHVPGIPQRIPSPRELQYHTQSIMQNALIRKKLEEQRENFRKRQEQEQKEQMQKQESERKGQDEVSPIQSPDENPFDSPIKKAPAQHQLQRQHAPSPNIFTPTSVLRKMTAEKDGDGKMGADKKKAITGGNSQPIRSQHQPQQQQYMGNLAQLDRMMQMQAQNDAFGKVNWEGQSSMKPQGRPIVKGAGPIGAPQNNPMMAAAQQQQQPNMMPPGNFDFQQHQMQKINMQKQFLQQQQHQQMMQMKKDNPVLTQFMAQQQQRAQQQQQHMIRSQQFPQQQMNFQQQQMMQGRPKEQDEMENRNMVNNGGCLSPTSNQLAKWFSPELLADATAGKLPSMKMNGQMMSSDEFENMIRRLESSSGNL